MEKNSFFIHTYVLEIIVADYGGIVSKTSNHVRTLSIWLTFNGTTITV